MRLGLEKDCRYGWLPWSAELNYDGMAAELAAVIERPGAGAVVVAESSTAAGGALDGPLGEVLHRPTVVTSRSRRRLPPARLVVCVWAGADEVGLARRCVASGGVVLVAEHSGLRLDGWARAVRAVNMRDLTLPPALPHKMVELLGDLDFHGNNGFVDIAERTGARRTLKLLGELPGYSRDLVLGALIARGYGDHHLKRVEPHMP